jgi:large subunit ribosomal protein L35
VAKRKVKKYKIKTHKATAKRFRVTGTGLVVRTRQGKSHFRRRKSGRVLRAMDKVTQVHNNKQARRIRLLAPYLGKYKANPPS